MDLKYPNPEPSTGCEQKRIQITWKSTYSPLNYELIEHLPSSHQCQSPQFSMEHHQHTRALTSDCSWQNFENFVLEGSFNLKNYIHCQPNFYELSISALQVHSLISKYKLSRSFLIFFHSLHISRFMEVTEQCV